MDRVQPLTLAQIREGGWLDPRHRTHEREDAEKTAA